ncbi:MAG TPA: DUF3078 domain-containing protein [Ferruginibacter sp.]|jgi:hypothetical protein|nr:DUF3078 domain-containing protein [Ferruginibacter sp.]MBN8698259.1 DUF3078 domain-containing protein [Chitinophagales bacterium]TXH29882.1 MAG: DUF3078 domain-containing protein [Cyclobacteriaceae bacterium]HMW25411.1 DUF3078 domain-containing protein [Ferruginibacter sp.]HNA00815.1 DUF3078 domain-containing protein [Ferruginibacter sp.]
MKTQLTMLLLLAVLLGRAQDQTVKDLKNEAAKSIAKDPKDTVQKTWKLGGLFNLNINQGSLSNWSAGGDKFSFSINSYLNLFAFYKKNRSSWDNNLDLAFGMTNTTSLGSRKASDRIDYLSKYGYALSKKWYAAALFNLRTQFAKGYAYSKTAAGKDTSTIISKSFAPAYVLLSLGFDYKPNADLSIFISPFTERWVIATDRNIAPLFGIDSSKKSKNELGAFASINYNKKLGKAFTFKTRLDLFSNYKQKPQNVDIFWSNVLTAKITKYINFSFNLDMIYDDNTQNVNPAKGPAPQWLQLMGIGFAYNFSNK